MVFRGGYVIWHDGLFLYFCEFTGYFSLILGLFYIYFSN